ncbi:MAG: rRNA maturation RNase YbeY [Deltaproteobacteria bacterium]|nr:rRNA maturation RNase YbeY [Deltaproteobacteria bacterium]MBW1911614.1 rRNA maturation RNase YbeY [Deltaproteobacteria bacterium]
MVRKALEDLACDEGELSILFTDDGHIADLNSRYLGRKGPTNVLAFPMSEDLVSDVPSGMLGDVVISIDKAVQESEESGEVLDETIYRLLIHGILHLLGYDHERSPEEEEIMQKKERRLLALIKEG